MPVVPEAFACPRPREGGGGTVSEFFDPTPAAEKFKIGQRVRMTPRAIEQGFQGRATSTEGVVVGVGKPSKQSVRVLRDGIKTPDTYYAGFWEPKP